RRRHTRSDRDWSSDVCSSDLSCFEGRPYLEMKTAREARRSFVPFVCFCFSGFPCPLHPRYPRNSRLKLRELAYTVGFPTQIIWELRLSFPVVTSERQKYCSQSS